MSGERDPPGEDTGMTEARKKPALTSTNDRFGETIENIARLHGALL